LAVTSNNGAQRLELTLSADAAGQRLDRALAAFAKVGRELGIIGG